MVLQRHDGGAPENVEIRFLRFSIQANTPSLLGLSQEIRADKQKILANLAEANYPRECARPLPIISSKVGSASRLRWRF
ncbi:MAG: hypothetical protein HC913_13645 [Microscillaceae bacterium]|nr:hypothetical protein [Microscillaceae bacterium]